MTSRARTARPARWVPTAPIRHPKRGYFGVALWHTKTGANLGTAVRSAYAFGAAFVATVGARYQKQSSDVSKAWRHMPVWHFADMDDLVAHVPYAAPLVAVELRPDAKHLPGWTHPERAIYVFGPEDGSLTSDVVGRCHHRVVIPGASHCLNLASSATVVLYDRVAKQVAAGGEARRPLYFIDYDGV